MSTAVNANVRVLELFVELLGARPGRTKTQLRALPGYQGLADDAFETQFQRDKDALRDAGAHMTIHAGERYSIAWDSFAPGIEVTSADRALMSLAARAWDSSEFFADAVDAKAAAASSEDVSAPMIRLGLTGLGAATTLSQAIRERRVVCFEYPGSGELTERSVDPWALSVQGRALYLWGWDLDRNAERTFRVSRIRSQVSFVGEPGDASLPPEGCTPPRVSSFVSPVVDVRAGCPARTILHGYEAGGVSEAVGLPRRGWERVCLEGAELGTWIARILPLAADVVVISPQTLREAVLTRLHAAAAWGDDHA